MSDQSYEEILLEQAQQGDIDAYTDLQTLLAPDIRRFVQRKIYDDFVVDDVMQEIFIAFYHSFPRIDPLSNLRPYLFRIARNKCYDYLRTVQRDNNISLDDEPVQMRVAFTEAHRQPKPDDMTHWMLLHLEVQEAIQQLPETQREALILFSEEQMTYAEIADITDVSIGTVKSRLYYAKKNLRAFLRHETLDILDEEFGNTPVNQVSASDEDDQSETEQSNEQSANVDTMTDRVLEEKELCYE